MVQTVPVHGSHTVLEGMVWLHMAKSSMLLFISLSTLLFFLLYSCYLLLICITKFSLFVETV